MADLLAIEFYRKKRAKALKAVQEFNSHHSPGTEVFYWSEGRDLNADPDGLSKTTWKAIAFLEVAAVFVEGEKWPVPLSRIEVV
ncbi:hypothetical protein [Gimesia aquarii]|uniref:Uncharacterized protein n=1 Tax=Gimesia aquarii TaxID=2527964 RepID=A0A517VYD1_9PLAN|nr:hypothetical protein [Gimesia aquarii]QDT98010.1 hypothetical protein V144x_34940 [Gimesia aquarii]